MPEELNAQDWDFIRDLLIKEYQILVDTLSDTREMHVEDEVMFEDLRDQAKRIIPIIEQQLRDLNQNILPYKFK